MTDRVWLASFKVDGLQRVASVRLGHDNAVAPTIRQLDIQLRVNEEEFAKDVFIPEASAADILALVSEEAKKHF